MSPSCKSTKVPRQLFAWATNLPDLGCGKCRTGYQQQCGELSQQLRTASLLRRRQFGVGSGRRHVGPPGLTQSCVSAFQWLARKISSQPEKDTTEEQYIMSGVTSVVD
ncbi:unnamed protein product [Mesocestoides corti]|uniref:Uncharacterized protein n=1 Tax=Mesocestoides corti TaxID=53468 RepID=A0A0R3UFU7_MESCO|nr:unnamed protein product [Mesocestoides corti]